MNRTICALAAVAMLAALPALAAPASLEVSKPWSRPAIAGATAAGFFTLTNRGNAADALVSASSPIAKRTEVHTSSMAGGVMRMSAQPRTALPAGGSVTFAPGGQHVMFIGLKRATKVGESFPATLVFASGAKLDVSFTVSTGLSSAPAMAGMSGHGSDMSH